MYGLGGGIIHVLCGLSGTRSSIIHACTSCVMYSCAMCHVAVMHSSCVFHVSCMSCGAHMHVCMWDVCVCVTLGAVHLLC